jgi:tRNA(adenine34) deaminase
MRRALDEARTAAARGEVPVGCVVVVDGRVIARAHNLRESLRDPTAHAEILALRKAARSVGSWRLDEAVVYCTLEPCCMCAGALVNARIRALVYGIADDKSGACGTVLNVAEEPRLNHRFEVRSGVLADQSLQLLREFFQPRRN